MQKSVNPSVPQNGTEPPAIADEEAPHQHSLPQLFAQWHTSEKGLTTQEAQERLGKEGPNELLATKRTAGFRQLLLLLTNPLVVILLAASIVSAAFGLLLPFTPLAVPLKMVPLPGLYFLFLAGATLIYLLLVQVVKRVLMRRWLGE